MKQFLLETFNIRPGEERAILLLLLFSTFFGAGDAFLYASSTSLFLKQFPSETMPYAFVASGLAGYALWYLSSRLQKWIGPLAMLGIFMIIVVAGTAFYAYSCTVAEQNPYIIFSVFIWMKIALYLGVVVFWGMAGSLFDLRQGKRLFGLIGTGEIISSTLGFLAVPFILRFISISQMMNLAAVAFAGCWAVYFWIRRSFTEMRDNKSTPEKIESQPEQTRKKGLFSLLADRYILLVFIGSMLPVFSINIVDYVFFDQARINFPDKEVSAGFFGYFWGFVSLAELLVKTFVSGRIITRYGVYTGLIVLPALMLFGMFLSGIAGTVLGATGLFFSFVAFSRMLDRVLRVSFNDPIFQILYQIFPAADKSTIQNTVEGGPKNLANSLAGALLLLLSFAGVKNLVTYTYLYVIVGLVWIYVCAVLYREYRSRLQDKVNHRSASVPEKKKHIYTYPQAEKISISQAEALIMSADPADRIKAAISLGRVVRYRSVQIIRELLNDPHPAVKRAAIATSALFKTPELNADLVLALSDPLVRHAAAAALVEIGAVALNELERGFHKLYDLETRRIILDTMGKIGGKKALSLLRDKLTYPDRLVRFEVMVALADSGYRVTLEEKPVVKQAIEVEMNGYFWANAAYLDCAESPGYDKDDKLARALEHEIAQKKNHIFALLAVMFDANTIRAVRDSIAGTGEGRGYALEILDLMVTPDVKELLAPIIEDLPPAEALRKFRDLYPQSRMSGFDRLRDILNADMATANRWTKACALNSLRLLRFSAAEKELLLSMIVHPDLLLAETAATLLYERDRNAWQEALLRFRTNKGSSIVNILESAPAGSTRMQRAYALMNVGRSMTLNSAPLHTLIDLAQHIQDIYIPPDAMYKPALSEYMAILCSGALYPVDNPHISSAIYTGHLLEGECTWKADSQQGAVLLHIPSINAAEYGLVQQTTTISSSPIPEYA
jgi:hypothetical protein